MPAILIYIIRCRDIDAYTLLIRGFLKKVITTGAGIRQHITQIFTSKSFVISRFLRTFAAELKS